MGILESDIQSQLHQLRCQLDQLRLTHRDTSLKFKREQQILKRVVASLSSAYQGSNAQVSEYLFEIQQELQHQKDVSTLIPRLAVLERMLQQQSKTAEKQNSHLDKQIKHSGETLQRITGLPAQLNRELRNLMSVSQAQTGKKVDQATKLLSIYERALKIITSHSHLHLSDLENPSDKSQLECLASELQHTITELDFEGGSGDKLLDIRAKLLLGVTAESLIELTLSTLKLVVDATTFERKASSQFLDQLNSSLASNLKTVHQNVDQHHTYFEHRQELNAEMNALIKSSQQSLDQAQDLAALKQEMAPLFANMTSVAERLKMAEEREQALQERLHYSKNQLEAVFETTQDYHRRLDDQAQRMLRDPLTKVYNRTAFNDRLELEYRRWIRSQKNLRVVLFDVDNFKAINDSYGYTAGDKALKIIARTINKRVSETETVARFGGEEFMLLLPEHSEEYTLDLIKHIQRDVSQLPFRFREQNLTITLTAVSTSFKDADAPEHVLERLRKMLSDAKKRGTTQLNWN
ncbi:diguanylate cyclase (GGDEF)-like protein [Vibrio sp. ES.051]|uniref:GGDEF domain-containing protein n=1 Tax=Vibrio sp. ES.051 TaxID=1761909 RepID=UPI000BF80C6D|nr:GGDEF domain-containing protein [Vibrio sp. ES.051]PFG55472.1 diguanylate cyclase (GGDEF)-like protein [Vibrio sp. ES.051]